MVDLYFLLKFAYSSPRKTFVLSPVYLGVYTKTNDMFVSLSRPLVGLQKLLGLIYLWRQMF